MQHLISVQVAEKLSLSFMAGPSPGLVVGVLKCLPIPGLRCHAWYWLVPQFGQGRKDEVTQLPNQY